MSRPAYDLQERLIEFGINVCKVVDRLPETLVGRTVAAQLVRSGTSPSLYRLEMPEVRIELTRGCPHGILRSVRPATQGALPRIS